jgi:geranylgeranyl pyrophosphate synthase
MSEQLEEFLEEQRQQTNALLEELAATVDAAPQLGAAMRYALQGDGKRLRPALCVACYRAADGDQHRAIQQVGLALEIIHTYSLVHDDLPCMDNDDFRRGRETVHRVYGTPAATLAGAALIPLAFEVAEQGLRALGLNAGERARAHRLVAERAGAAGMVGGQLLDLEGGASITSVTELERIHAAKTGALIEAACLLGAVAAHAAGARLRGFALYGRHLGLAFQITDDVLDETASTTELGKTAGKDRDGAKATYPALLGLEEARRRARSEADLAKRSLQEAGIHDGLLHDLASFAIERRR